MFTCPCVWTQGLETKSDFLVVEKERKKQAEIQGDSHFRTMKVQCFLICADGFSCKMAFFEDACVSVRHLEGRKPLLSNV
jgi:hypothetical protein